MIHAITCSAILRKYSNCTDISLCLLCWKLKIPFKLVLLSHSFWKRFGIVSSVLNHELPSPTPSIVSDNRQSVKSHQLSVGRKRFPFSSEVVCSCTDVLVNTEECDTVRKRREGESRGETEGLGMKEKEKQVSYALMIQSGAATLRWIFNRKITLKAPLIKIKRLKIWLGQRLCL